MTIKRIQLFMFMLAISMASIAQVKMHEADNLLFLLRETGHISQALKTAEHLRSAKSGGELNTSNIAVIICGNAVNDFTGNRNSEVIDRAKKAGVTLYGCGLSMDKFGIKKEDLSPGIEYVQNGFIKAFQLQKAGYLSVEL